MANHPVDNSNHDSDIAFGASKHAISPSKGHMDSKPAVPSPSGANTAPLRKHPADTRGHSKYPVKHG